MANLLTFFHVKSSTPTSGCLRKDLYIRNPENHEIEFDGYIAVMEPRREGMTMPKAYHTHEQETERIY